jgi:Ca-activated chloride channel family protein
MSEFHFASPYFFALLLLLPLLWWPRRKRTLTKDGSDFADAHLLPYLRVGESAKPSGRTQRTRLLWAAVWLLLCIAMAGPRWEREATKTFQADAAVMIVLDLSRSMLATDLTPNRLERAHQAITALLQGAAGMRVGLIVFAADAVIASPLTRDHATLSKLLPSLEPSLFTRQGSVPEEAIALAARHLQHDATLHPNARLHLLLVTDGDVPEVASSLATQFAELASATPAIQSHNWVLATSEGAPVPDGQGHMLMDKSGKAHLSRPLDAMLQAASEAGKGATTRVQDPRAAAQTFLSLLETTAAMQEAEGSAMGWREEFLWPLLAALILLWWRTPPLLIAVVCLLFVSPAEASELQGLYHFERQNFSTAAEALEDPYRRGVALYRAGDFAAAAAAFAQSASHFNQGNSWFQQRDYARAIEAYRAALEIAPDDQDTRFNLALAEALLKQQQSKGEKPKKSDTNPQDASEAPSPSETSDNKGHDNSPPTQDDATLDRMLQQMDGQPSDILKQRIGQQEKAGGRARRGGAVNPW